MSRKNQEKACITTTFQLSRALHNDLKVMCMLTEKSMGEFIRIAIIDKIKQVKLQNIK